jgi:hypothetical protein
MNTALRIDPRDNVAVVLVEIKKGEEVLVTGDIRLTAQSDIPFGHKIAVAAFHASDPIIKYGEEIGKAKNPIQSGEWVHLRNVYCDRGREDQNVSDSRGEE